MSPPLTKPGARRPRQVRISTIMVAVAVVAVGCGIARALGPFRTVMLVIPASPVAIGVAYAMLSSWVDRVTFGRVAAWWRSRRRAAPPSRRPGD